MDKVVKEFVDIIEERNKNNLWAKDSDIIYDKEELKEKMNSLLKDAYNCRLENRSKCVFDISDSFHILAKGFIEDEKEYNIVHELYTVIVLYYLYKKCILIEDIYEITKSEKKTSDLIIMFTKEHGFDANKTMIYEQQSDSLIKRCQNLNSLIENRIF